MLFFTCRKSPMLFYHSQLEKIYQAHVYTIKYKGRDNYQKLRGSSSIKIAMQNNECSIRVHQLYVIKSQNNIFTELFNILVICYQGIS